MSGNDSTSSITGFMCSNTPNREPQMRLLSQELASGEYLRLLKQDLDQASVCRFLIAYVSPKGVAAIGQHRLHQALQDPRSFGVRSLACKCGYAPFVDLQSALGDANVRLKYFMDPKVTGTDERGTSPSSTRSWSTF